MRLLLSSFDEHSFEALHQCESPSSAGNSSTTASPPPRYEWYWEDDIKQFTQYSQTASDTLTAAMLENPHKRCPLQIDGKVYIVDLSSSRQ